MAVRTRSQKKGDIAEEFVCALIDRHPCWLARRQDRDFGVDLEAELAIPSADDQRLAGKLIKIQVKGSESWKQRDGRIAVSLHRDYLDYIAQFRLPVLLVAADVSTEKAWFIWLQEWLLENEIRLAQGERTETVTVHVPAHQQLDEGLNGPIQRIARGEEATAMVLALRELATTATSTGDTIILKSVLDLLDKIDEPNRLWTVQKTIDALIGLGPNVGFWRTQELIPSIQTIVDRLGNSLTQDQVLRLVSRGETYSRAGLQGLSRLYDRWPAHARELKLPVAFRSINLEPVAWYCDFRQRYSDLSSLDLWIALGKRSLPDTQFGPLMVANDPDVADRIFSKWPNRGDSIFLDCLVWVDQPESEETDRKSD
ncbi:DUF4365 domain-containing protein [Reyranella sp. CPCC 100927]|uniref:DUF4365 domain-containing protein n=1 Tax=Reyranella sp. CPCC 100927 TaxID=2599616 RepID=UPI0015B4C811|nr:DUF4365 domain-containing protein [Reyranella sp. CPCC 100927]